MCRINCWKTQHQQTTVEHASLEKINTKINNCWINSTTVGCVGCVKCRMCWLSVGLVELVDELVGCV